MTVRPIIPWGWTATQADIDNGRCTALSGGVIAVVNASGQDTGIRYDAGPAGQAPQQIATTATVATAVSKIVVKDWAAGEDVLIEEIRRAPSTVDTIEAGDLIRSTADRTTGSAWNATEAGFWTEFSPDIVTSVAGKTGAVALVKGDVGLGSADNTSDANKPISTAQQAALNGKANSSHTHAQSDVTSLATDLAAKQATLVSGTNIKTVGGTTLLGAGDVPFPAFATSLRLMTPADIIEDAQRMAFLFATDLAAGAVSAWGTFSQSTAGYQPVAETVATLGGRMAVKFDGADDHMSSAHINLGASYGIFAVIRTGATVSVNNHVVSAQYPNSVEYAFSAGTNFEGGTSGGPGMGIGHYNGAWRGVEGAAAAASTTYILLGQYTDGGTGFSFAVNGGTAVTNATNSTPSVADSNTIWLGRRWDGVIDASTVFNGHIAALVLKAGVFTAAERAQLEGWAAWYYGLVSALPAGHTYKNSPPLITA